MNGESSAKSNLDEQERTEEHECHNSVCCREVNVPSGSDNENNYNQVNSPSTLTASESENEELGLHCMSKRKRKRSSSGDSSSSDCSILEECRRQEQNLIAEIREMERSLLEEARQDRLEFENYFSFLEDEYSQQAEAMRNNDRELFDPESPENFFSERHNTDSSDDSCCGCCDDLFSSIMYSWHLVPNFNEEEDVPGYLDEIRIKKEDVPGYLDETRIKKEKIEDLNEVTQPQVHVKQEPEEDTEDFLIGVANIMKTLPRSEQFYLRSQISSLLSGCVSRSNSYRSTRANRPDSPIVKVKIEKFDKDW